jgi:hypothetical protein
MMPAHSAPTPRAGQNYGTTLLWTLLLLVPVLYVNQEMVLRLGAVTGVGHARPILERFGRFWSAFSVIDLFLMLLCNDHAVLGPWVNGRWLNVFTGAVIAVLLMLSIVLTASVLYPDMGETTILAILGGGTLFTIAIAAALLVIRGDDRRIWTDSFGRMIWRMPPLDQLPPAHMTPLTRIWLSVLRGYLVVAGGLVLWRIVELAAFAA